MGSCDVRLDRSPADDVPFSGECEVTPERSCIWVRVYERAKDAGEIPLLKIYIPPPDRSLKGTSSWINYFLQRDSRPGSPRNVGPLAPPSSQEESKANMAVTQ